MSVRTSVHMSGALDLLVHVFGERPGIVGLFSGLRAAAGAPNLNETRSAYFRWPGEHLAVCEWLRHEGGQGREAYFCAHLLTAPRRIKVNTAHMLACYVDADGAKVPPSVPVPTAVVESSPGRDQLYWRLCRPVAPEFGETLNRRLALAVGGDHSGWDITQLLRAPGTRNHKYPDAPLVMLREVTNETYDPDDLDRLQPSAPTEAPAGAHNARRPAGVGPAPDLSRLSPRIRNLVERGNRGEYLTRSEADFAACLALFGAGYDAADVWAVMTNPTNGISAKYHEKGRDGERYLALTIGKAEAQARVSPRRRPSRSRARRVRRGPARG